MTAMPRTKAQIPQSALYTAATWQWGRVPCADLVTPDEARKIFDYYNAFMWVYRLVNPRWHSLKHTLLHRHGAINHLLERSSLAQVIEIAAGFSPRGCSVSSNPAVRYFEVDLPEVTALKRDQLASTDAGRSVLGRANFHAVTGDIRAPDLFSSFPAVASFVITEGLMMYFSREEQMAIWNTIAAFVRDTGGAYVFDYLPLPDEPRRSWLGRYLARRRKPESRVFKYDERTRAEVARDLRAAGFAHVDVHESWSFAVQWNLPHANETTRVVIYHCY